MRKDTEQKKGRAILRAVRFPLLQFSLAILTTVAVTTMAQPANDISPIEFSSRTKI